MQRAAVRFVSVLVVGAFAAVVGLLVLWQNASQELNNTRRALDAAISTLETAQRELAELSRAHDALAAERANLSVAFADVTGKHEALALHNATLDQDLRRARTDLHRTETFLNQSMKQVQTLQQKYETLQRDHTRLADTSASVESLEAEIERLEGRLQPLILRERTVTRSGFACTGSMEPTVTCLDEAEWLGKFEPSEVIAGMTIDFDPDCTEGEPNGRGTTHRVVKVKVENGIYYYWPKGDGNREADGCWIPVGHVTGYMIALYQDTQPQNESLRQSVLYVRSAY